MTQSVNSANQRKLNNGIEAEVSGGEKPKE